MAEKQAKSFLQSYDLAVKATLYSKFASILEIDAQTSLEEDNINLGIFQLPKEVVQRSAAEKRGQTYLEFINFWRTGASFSWSRNRTPLSRRGMWLSNAEDAGINTVHVKAVPIDLTYNAWFWSKDLDKIYQVMEDYVFWQQDNPKVSLTYDDSYSLEPDLHFGEIVDESTVSEQFSEGIIYVYKMPIKIDAWVLKGLSFKTIQKIQVTVYDKNDVTEYSEIVVEDINQDTELEAALRFFRRKLYRIYSIDTGANSLTIAGSYVSDFTVGNKLRIENSTYNNAEYTIVSATLTAAKTVVIVTESIPNSLADGNIYLVS